MAFSVLKQMQKSLSGRDNAFNARAILAVLIFGMIIAVFVLSDLSGKKGGQMGAGAAAMINGEVVSIKEFQAQQQRNEAYYAQLFGGQFDSINQRQQVIADTMNQIVNSAVAVQAAKNAAIFATDQEVRKKIYDMPYFKQDGVFQAETYKNMLAANNMSRVEFEESLRKEIVMQKLQRLFLNSYGTTELEKAVNQGLKSAQLNVQYVKLDGDTFKSAVTDSEVKAKLADAGFKKQVEDYYKVNSSNFETPDEVRASHILIRSGPQDNASKVEAKAKEILAKSAKEDFGKLASEFSEDPGSKIKKGDLGFFERKSMVKEFADAAFGLEKGQVSGLVKTQFGFHIIKVTDKKPGHRDTVEEANLKIGHILLAKEKYLAAAKEMEDTLSQQPNQIEAVLAKHKLNWSETGYFGLDSETAPQVNSANVFNASLSLSKANPIANKLIREGDSQYIIRLKDSKKVDLVSTEPENELAVRQKATSGYQRWVDAYKKTSTIETNEKIFQ